MMNINNQPHTPFEEQIDLPYYLVDHNYSWPIVSEKNSNKQKAFPYHLVDHDYFQPVLNKNNPNEQIALLDHLVDHDYFQPVVYKDNLNEEIVDVEVLEDKDLTEVEVVDKIPEEIFNDQVPETYIIIPGIHHGSKVYVDNLGFKYYKREERANCIYLICERQKSRLYNFCPCTAIVSRELTDNSITIRAQHNHPSPNINVHAPLLREAIGTRSIDLTEVKVVDKIPEEIFNDQVPETYITIPGIHHGSKVYVDNLGYKYYKREERVNYIYLICERQKSRLSNFCPCTAIVSRKLTDNSIKIRAQHNHPSPNINVHVPFLREAIGARSIDLTNMCVSVRTVYNDAIIEFSEAAENYTFTQGQRRWKRMRRYRQPNG